MGKIFLLSALITAVSICSFGQDISSLKLSAKEIPAGYNKPTKLLCDNSLVEDIYNNPGDYPMIGYIEKKDFQSFEKGSDKGSILYFEFSDELTEKEKDNLDTFLIKNQEPYFIGKLVIIWCLNNDSEIKKISKAKITAFSK